MDTQTANRRLAAILAADVVGYSKMMSDDEAGTLAALNRHRADDFNPVVARHNGRIVKLMGDGTLVEFNSVVDAVNCAVAIQRAIDASGGLVLRMGINLGDIITQGDDIFGDGVNIAARLEQLAKPGGICVSSVVNESTGGRIAETFADGGSVSVKNIDRPLRVFHWHPDSNAPAPNPTGAPTRSATPSIAVLPFDNMSGDAEQEYFSDGISEDIITDLSKVSGLMVIARNSSFTYKGKSVDLRTVGQQLGVTHVLEGSIRRAGQRVRITAQLIDATTGGHVWADRFDRDLTDIFAVQDEVTFEIVNALKVRLSPAEKKNIAEVGTTNLEAHENFMRLRSYLFFPGMNADLWKRAIGFGERAIELDPEYAQAYAMLSIMHILDFHNHWSGAPPEEVLAKCMTLAEKAVSIAPDDLMSIEAVAVAARFQGDFDRALPIMNRILSENPDNSLSLFTRGEILMSVGRLRESLDDLERAIRLDPAFSHQYLQFLGMCHYLLGNYETAALMFRERLALASTTDIGRAWLAATLGQLGELEEARTLWAELMVLNPTFDIVARLKRWSFSDPAHPERVMAGLAKAGLPKPA